MNQAWTDSDSLKAVKWDAKNELSQFEAACLIVGVWPDEMKNATSHDPLTDEPTGNSHQKYSLYLNVYQIITDKIEKKKIKAVEDFKQGYILKRKDVIGLAELLNQIHPMLFKKKRAGGITASPNLSEYMDSKHEYFSKELEAAVSAWIFLFQQNGLRGKRTVKEQIKDWLKKNRPKIAKSNSALDRIATVCNPNKKGGAPKTEPA